MPFTLSSTCSLRMPQPFQRAANSQRQPKGGTQYGLNYSTALSAVPQQTERERERLRSLSPSFSRHISFSLTSLFNYSLIVSWAECKSFDKWQLVINRFLCHNIYTLYICLLYIASSLASFQCILQCRLIECDKGGPDSSALHSVWLKPCRYSPVSL